MAVIRLHMAHRSDKLRFIEKIAQEARASVEAVSVESLDTGLCHGDLHGDNLHLHEGRVTHFDFEECAFGYRVYDLATLKWGSALGFDAQRAKRWPAFLRGYESVRAIAEVDRSLIDTFVVIRELAELAYGIRNVADFGHGDIMASDIDSLCERMKEILATLNR